LANFETKLPTWIDVGVWTITILLIWLGILQLGLFVQGIDLIQRQNKSNEEELIMPN
jgi:hypothetical protein